MNLARELAEQMGADPDDAELIENQVLGAWLPSKQRWAHETADVGLRGANGEGGRGMMAPEAAAPTRPGRCDQQSPQTAPTRPTAGRKNTRPRADPGFAALRCRPASARARRFSPARARNTQAATRAKTALPSPASRVHGADPRKAAAWLPEIGAFEALEVPENARCAGREPPLSLSGGRRAPLVDTRLPCRPTASARRHGPPHANTTRRRGGSVFRGAARPRVPGAVSEWVRLGKPSSPAIRNRAPNRKTEHARAFGSVRQVVSGAARAQQTSPWTARSSLVVGRCV